MSRPTKINHSSPWGDARGRYTSKVSAPSGSALSARGSALTDRFQVEVGTVGLSNHGRVTVRQDDAFPVRKDEVVDPRLLGCFNQELLKLKTPPLHARPRAAPGLKGPDDRLALFDEKTCREFPLFRDALEVITTKMGTRMSAHPIISQGGTDAQKVRDGVILPLFMVYKPGALRISTAQRNILE